MKISLVLCLVCSGYLGLPSTALAKPPIVSGIGNIQNTKEIQGAGCSLQRKGRKDYVFWSAFEKSALMNINGKDRVLKLVSVNPSAPRVEKKGDRSTEIYQSGKITVRIDRVATRVCRKGDQECEVTNYNGKMTLKIGDSPQERLRQRQQTIAVEGDCGS